MASRRNLREMERMVAAIRGFVRAYVIAAVETLVMAASVRVGVAPGAPVAEGELRGSPRITIGAPSTEQPVKKAFYPIIGAFEVQQALTGFEVGDVVYITWIAGHSAIIEGGRKINSRGWWMGSLEAPDGFVVFAIDETQSVMLNWRYQP